MIEATIPVDGPDEAVLLFGVGDEHLKRVRRHAPATIATRGDGSTYPATNAT